MTERKKWSEKDTEFLKNNYGTMTYKEMSVLIGWSEGTIRNKASELDISRKAEVWTKEQEELLKEHYPYNTTEELLTIFPKRTAKSIKAKAERMGLEKIIGKKMVYWSTDEVELLRKHYPSKDKEFFKSVLPNKKWSQIQQKASREGINRYKISDTPRRKKRNWNSNEEIKEYVESKGHLYLRNYFNKNGSRVVEFLDVYGANRKMELTLYLKYQGNLPVYKHYYEHAVAHIEENGYEVISKREEYVSGETMLTLRCPEKHIWKCDFTRFRSGVRCSKCYHTRRAVEEYLKESVIIENLKNLGLKNIKILKYRGTKSTISFICENHINKGSQVKVYSDVVSRKRGCSFCGIDDRSGENHPFWKEGVTNLTHWSRGRSRPWIKDTLKHYNYTCEITGRKDNLEVHHKIPFKDILSDSLEETGLIVKENIALYSKDELENLKETLLRKHYECGLGACITEEVHTLFHKIYGKFDNTPQQFEEFKERCNTGEFDHVLKGD